MEDLSNRADGRTASARRNSASASNKEVGHQLYVALIQGDWAALRDLLTADATWTLPGDNAISGRVEGGDAVAHHFRKIAGYGVNFALQHVLVSRDNVALSLRNTARRHGLVLDEYLATVCRLRGGKIYEIETYLNDVDGMDAFFARVRD
jgi:ketosteroid isomerase-like protein